MKSVSRIPAPQPWFVYVAQVIFSKDEKGIAYKNYLTLEKQHVSYPNFSEASGRMEVIGHDIQKVNKGRKGYSSRSKDWCVDFYLVSVPENDTLERDCFAPAYRGIEIISTPYALKLNNLE